nr:uncharacterized mitochondrial protein AtMg00810-like [Tanacetum cinerariifolium]
MVRNKAWLVVQGHTQEEGIDYDEVFALVARIEAIRMFLAYAPFKNFVVYQMDVKSTFLYGQIEEEVYVCQPLGFEDPEFHDKVYKVEKALYGLHQAPRAWTSSTPMETSKPLMKNENDENVDVHINRSMIGSLMYLTSSRPDIMFVVCACARFQVTPKVSHLHAMKRIFRYLKGQPKLGLWYPKDSPFDLEAYTNSDHAGASLDRKSTRGCQFLRSRLISWQCKKQTIVATSTTEVELMIGMGWKYYLDEIRVYIGNSRVSAAVYYPPKKDLFWTRLPEFADDTVTDYSMPSPAIESTSDDVRNRNTSVTKTEASPTTISPKPFIKFVKATVRPTENKTVKVETIKKHVVKYTKQYRKPLKKFTVRGNQRNWNNMKSQQLGVKKGRTCSTNTHKNNSPRPVVHKTHRPQMRPIRLNVNAAKPKRTSFYKPAHSYAQRPFQRESTVWKPVKPNSTSIILKRYDYVDVRGRSRKAKSKVTEIPQSSEPTNLDANEAVHEDMGDSVERAATTAASLDAEQDSSTINRTQSTIPIVSFPQGFGAGGRPRRQETMGDKPAQTRFERLSKQSNGTPLLRVNTLRSGEDNIKLKELMKLFTKLSAKVFDLETTKTAQAKEIVNLKKRVKRLERKRQSQTLRMKLFKINTYRGRSLGKEDASKQRRNDFDDEGFNAYMNDVFKDVKGDAEQVISATVDEVSIGDAVNTASTEVNTANAPITTAGISVTTAKPNTSPSLTTTIIEDEDLTIAQTLIKMRNKGKGKRVEQEKPLKKKDQIKFDEEVAQGLQAKLHAELEEEECMAKQREENANIAEWDDVQAMIYADYELDSFVSMDTKVVKDKAEGSEIRAKGSSKRAVEDLQQESTKKQKVDDDDKEKEDLKQCFEIVLEEVAINAIPLAIKPAPIIGFKIHRKGRIGYYEIMRADKSTKTYLLFSQLLKEFDRDDLENLWKVVKAKH